jgi:pentatricopeptide repeat protein
VVPLFSHLGLWRSYTTDVLSSHNSSDVLGEEDATDGEIQMQASLIVVDNDDDHDDTITMPLEKWPRERSSQNVMTIIMDPQVQEFLQKMQAMNDDTQAVRNDPVVVQVLQESLQLLKHQYAQGNVTSAIKLTASMQQLFDLWRTNHVQNITQPRTSKPFQILLETWSLAASHDGMQSFVEPKEHNEEENENPGIKAMQVLQRWYELLAGDLELKPHLESYNQALRILAKVSTSMAQQARRKRGADRVQQQLELVSLVSDAHELVQNLNHWGYSVAPTMETYSHLVRCLANIIVTLQPQNDDAVCVDDLKTAWMRLEAAMENGVEVLAGNRIVEKKSSASMFTFTRKEDPESLYFYTQALCDALVATKAAREMNKQLSQRNQLPVKAVYSEAVKMTETKKDEEVDGSKRWQRWGAALVEHVLNRPERMASNLQYERDLKALRGSGNNNEMLPEMFETLVGGCEAWQSLSHWHLSSASNIKRGIVSTEILHVLESLEGLSEHLDRSQQEEAYVALLRCYLWSIKALQPRYSDNDKTEAIKESRDNVLHRWLQRHQAVMSQYDSSTLGTGNTFDNLQGRQEDQKPDACSLSDVDLLKLRQRATISSSMMMRGMFHVGKLDIVDEMWRDMSKRGLPLDAGTYGVILKALASTKTLDAAPKAHKLLKQLNGEWKKRDISSGAEAAVPINADHFASVLVAWSRSFLREKAPRRALQVFNQLQKDFRKAVERREDYAVSLQPKPFHYYVLLAILAKVRDRDKQEFVDSGTVQVARQLIEDIPPKKRTVVACRVAMFALLKVGTLEAAQLSSILLNDMRGVFERENDHEMRPTVLDYGNCMHTWARAAIKGQAKDAHLTNQQLLQRLESEFIASGYDPRFLPNNVVYLAVVRAIVSTQQASVGNQAEELLQRMLEKAAIGQAQPPFCRFYNDVIFARADYAGPHCGEKAEAILELMKESCFREGTLEAKPTAYTYHGVIRAWSRGTDPDKAAHAERLLAEMHDLFHKQGDIGAMPDRNVYAAVLQACVHTPSVADANQRGNALRIGLQTLVDMREHLQAPTSFMYNLMLNIVHRNVEDPSERSRIALVVFQECCEEGLVDVGVERALQQCAPHLHRRIPKDPKAKHQAAVPPEWTRNVKKPSTNRPQR